MCDVQGMSVTTAKPTQRAYSRVPQVFWVTAHIVGFRVVLRVDLVLRVVNGVLVPVTVYSILICVHIPCIIHIAKTLHPTSVTENRRQL